MLTMLVFFFLTFCYGKSPLLGTWVKSSFVVRSRPFVVSTMGSVTAQHYDISFYACYHKLNLHETHRDTVMLMFVLSWHRPYCSVDMYMYTYTCVYMHVLKLLHSTGDASHVSNRRDKT